MAHELGDREYLGMIRGEIVWNHRDGRWERRNFDPSHPWWKLGIDRSGGHPDSPVPLPKEPPPALDTLPPNEPPSGSLTHDQLVRIHQINDLASREVITDAARDDEANRIASEGH